MIDLTNIEFYKNPDDNWKEEKINGRKFVFPNEWKIDILKNILKGNTGFTPPTNNETNFIGQTKWINISDMNKKFIENKKFLNDNITTIKNKKLDKGSLLFSFKLSIGKVGFTKYDDMVTNEAIIGYSPKNNSNLNFYYYAMPKYTILNTGKNAFGMDLMNLELIENSKMILPNNLEQEKIASILETQENLILSKKELLEKYKKQRKYFQQELLSGRIRMKLNNKSMAEAFELGLIKQTFLNDANEEVEYGGDTITNVNIDIIDKDGFESWLSIDFENKIEFYKNIDFKEEKINGRNIRVPEDFINFKLNDIFTFEKGKNAGIFTNDYINKNKGLFPVYSGKTGNNGIFGNINTFLYDLKNVLFITTVGEKAMSINLLNGKFSLSQNCALLLNKTKNNDLFLYYIVDKIMFEERIKLSSGVKPSFRKSDMNNINIFIPNIIEQTLIGEQLTKIDNLIESLEEEIKLEDKKFTYLKQELLSGRIRVN